MAGEHLMSHSTGRNQQSFHTFNNQLTENIHGKNGNKLECRVCEESFCTNGDKIPRLLYCGHTLCHACLLRLPVNNAGGPDSQTNSSSAAVICCPFDRQTTPIGANGVWGLKKNFALLEVLEKYSGGSNDRTVARPLLSPDLLTHTYSAVHSGSAGNSVGCNGGVAVVPAVPCEEDETHVAVLYCTVCSSHLCHACSERSHATRTLHTHRRIPIADKPREKPRCPAHPSHTVEFVCLEPDCTSSTPFMCFICKDYKHTKHKHALLEAEAESVRSELATATHNVRRAALQLTHLLRKLEHAARELDDQQPSDSTEGETLSEGGGAPLPAVSHGLSSLVQTTIESSTQGGTSGSDGGSGPSSLVITAATAASTHVQPHSQLTLARERVRSHFSELRQQLQEQENVAVAALETHVRERLTSIRQQQEDLSTLVSQMVGLVLESDRCLQHDDGRLVLAGRCLTAKLHLLQTPQLDDIEQDITAVEDTIPITFTKDNRIHLGTVLEMRVVTLGLDGAGKTSILCQLQQQSCPPTIPTIGFNVEHVHYKNFKFTIWDVGGGTKLRPLWRHYYYNTKAIMFVVDASALDRIEEATTELTKLMMERELRDVPLLIYANKQNIEGSLSPPDVSLALGAGKLCSGRPWHVVGCDALTGQGLTDGLDWLTRQLGPLNA